MATTILAMEASVPSLLELTSSLRQRHIQRVLTLRGPDRHEFRLDSLAQYHQSPQHMVQI